MKKQITDWEKTFANPCLIKDHNIKYTKNSSRRYKDAQHHLALGKCKSKPPWYRFTSTRMLTSEKLTKPSGDKDVEQRELSFLVGMQNGTATVKIGLEVSYKVRNILTMYSCNPTPRYLPKWNENLCFHKNLSTNVQSGFIHSCQKLRTTSSTGGWISCSTSI